MAEVDFEQRGREIVVANSNSLAMAAHLLDLSPKELECELVSDVKLVRQHRCPQGVKCAAAVIAEKHGLMTELYCGIVRKILHEVNKRLSTNVETQPTTETCHVLEVLQVIITKLMYTIMPV